MKKILKTLLNKKVYYLLLIICFVILLFGFRKVFSIKSNDGIWQMQGYYDIDADALDVLVVGTSHAFVNVNPMVIWEDYGITTYDLCAGNAPMWNSYYYLKEAFKHGKPKMVALEAYALANDYEYISHEGEFVRGSTIYNTYGIKSIYNRYKSIITGTPEEELRDLIPEFRSYHSRYLSLERADFLDDLENDDAFDGGLGHVVYNVIQPQTPGIDEYTDERGSLPKKQGEYYQKIIDLCKENDVELFVFLSPYAYYSKKDDAIFNTASDIAINNGLNFVNFNKYYDEIGVNWETDFADFSHMNYIGNEKYSKFFGNVLATGCGMKGHLGENDDKYADWINAAIFYNHRKTERALKEISEDRIEDYINIINALPDEYDVIFTVNTDIGDWHPFLKEYLTVCGIPCDDDYKEFAWKKNTTVVKPYSTNELNYIYFDTMGDNEIAIDEQGIWWNGVNVKRADNGINIIVLDHVNNTLVDSIGIFDEWGYSKEQNHYVITRDKKKTE